jgi:hypothetical protein
MKYRRDNDSFVVVIYGIVDHKREYIKYGSRNIIIPDSRDFRVLADE